MSKVSLLPLRAVKTRGQKPTSEVVPWGHTVAVTLDDGTRLCVGAVMTSDTGIDLRTGDQFNAWSAYGIGHFQSSRLNDGECSLIYDDRHRKTWDLNKIQLLCRTPEDAAHCLAALVLERERITEQRKTVEVSR